VRKKKKKKERKKERKKEGKKERKKERRKERKKQDENIMSASATQGGHNNAHLHIQGTELPVS